MVRQAHKERPPDLHVRHRQPGPLGPLGLRQAAGDVPGDGPGRRVPRLPHPIRPAPLFRRDRPARLERRLPRRRGELYAKAGVEREGVRSGCQQAPGDVLSRSYR